MWTAYLAIGDSTTAGYGDAAAGIACRSWTDLVADALASATPDLRYRNAGHNGATASTVLRKQVPLIRRFRPDLVSVTAGANDARSRDWDEAAFAAQYSAIVRAIVDSGAQPLTLAYPDISLAIAAAGRPLPALWRPALRRLHEVNEVIRSASARFGACLLDMEHFPEASDPRYLSRDLAHPNALGYLKASEYALELLATRFDVPELRAAVCAPA